MSSKAAQSARDSFVTTKEHRRFVEFCDACRRDRYIGLCYGPPGVGKTLSARRYAQWDLLEPYLRFFRRDRLFPPKLDWNQCRTVVYTAPVVRSPKQIGEDVRSSCSHLAITAAEIMDSDEIWNDTDSWTELLIVDEADRLKTAGLEQLRDIYDHQGVGVVLVGMPGIEKRLSRYPQLYSRVGFVHRFRPLSAEEARFILKNKWEALGRNLDPNDSTDEETVAAVLRITGGNFRLLDRLLTQVERVLQINEMKTVTKEVVETARENLVIGVA